MLRSAFNLPNDWQKDSSSLSNLVILEKDIDLLTREISIDGSRVELEREAIYYHKPHFVDNIYDWHVYRGPISSSYGKIGLDLEAVGETINCYKFFNMRGQVQKIVTEALPNLEKQIHKQSVMSVATYTGYNATKHESLPDNIESLPIQLQKVFGDNYILKDSRHLAEQVKDIESPWHGFLRWLTDTDNIKQMLGRFAINLEDFHKEFKDGLKESILKAGIDDFEEAIKNRDTTINKVIDKDSPAITRLDSSIVYTDCGGVDIDKVVDLLYPKTITLDVFNLLFSRHLHSVLIKTSNAELGFTATEPFLGKDAYQCYKLADIAMQQKMEDSAKITIAVKNTEKWISANEWMWIPVVINKKAIKALGENVESGLTGDNSVIYNDKQYPSIGFECELRGFTFQPNAVKDEGKDSGEVLLKDKTSLVSLGKLNIHSDNIVKIQKKDHVATFPELVSDPLACHPWNIANAIIPLIKQMRVVHNGLKAAIVVEQYSDGMQTTERSIARTIFNELLNTQIEAIPKNVYLKRGEAVNAVCQLTYTVPVNKFAKLFATNADKSSLAVKYMPSKSSQETVDGDVEQFFTDFLYNHYISQMGFIQDLRSDNGGKKHADATLKYPAVAVLPYFNNVIQTNVYNRIASNKVKIEGLINTIQQGDSLSQMGSRLLKKDFNPIEKAAIEKTALPSLFYNNDAMTFGPYKSHDEQDLILGVELRSTKHSIIKLLDYYVSAKEYLELTSLTTKTICQMINVAQNNLDNYVKLSSFSYSRISDDDLLKVAIDTLLKAASDKVTSFEARCNDVLSEKSCWLIFQENKSSKLSKLAPGEIGFVLASDGKSIKVVIGEQSVIVEEESWRNGELKSLARVSKNLLDVTKKVNANQSIEIERNIKCIADERAQVLKVAEDRQLIIEGASKAANELINQVAGFYQYVKFCKECDAPKPLSAFTNKQLEAFSAYIQGGSEFHIQAAHLDKEKSRYVKFEELYKEADLISDIQAELINFCEGVSFQLQTEVV